MGSSSLEPQGPKGLHKGPALFCLGGEEECPQNLALGMTACQPGLLPTRFWAPALLVWACLPLPQVRAHRCQAEDGNPRDCVAVSKDTAA